MERRFPVKSNRLKEICRNAVWRRESVLDASSGQGFFRAPSSCLSSESSSSEPRTTDVRKINALRGPNIWARDTMLECRVQFPEIASFVPNWTDWLVSWLPALEPAFKEVAKPDADTLARLLVDITLHLQSRTDLQVSFGKVMP
ncbi:MAG: hypothetical protein RIS79_542, partial [Verrucomicrobiota bacterium]